VTCDEENPARVVCCCCVLLAGADALFMTFSFSDTLLFFLFLAFRLLHYGIACLAIS